MKFCVLATVLLLGATLCAEPPRLVVAGFRAANGDTFSWCGKAESTTMWAATVVDRLTESLTRARKFTMIDRKFDAEVKDEIARLSDASASKEDAVRLGRRLGTDYMVVGEVRFQNVPPPVANPVTGQLMPMASQRFADVSYRLIDVPTGVIKSADTICLDAAAFPVADMATFVSATTDCAAEQIRASLLDELFPKDVKNASAAPVAAASAAEGAVVVPPPATSVRGTGTGGVVTPF